MVPILSFDPGHTTGIAALNSQGDLIFAMSVPASTLGHPNFFGSLLRLVGPARILVERVPPVNPDPTTAALQVQITRWFEVAGIEVVQINPGQWKNMVKRETLSGTHMTDAFMMAKWYQLREEERLSHINK